MKRIDIIQSIRRTWDMSPVTRVKKSKKNYNRKQKHKGAIHA